MLCYHLQLSEFNHYAGTLSHVTVDNSTCVTTKFKATFKSHHTPKRYFIQFAINDNDVSARKSKRKCHSIYLSRCSLRFGKLRRGNRFLK